MMIVAMTPVVGIGELWLIHLVKNQSKLGKETPRKINKDVLDWDNGTSDCVDENEIYFEKNGLNMKVLAEKLEFPS